MQQRTTIHSLASASLALSLIACGGARTSTPPAHPQSHPTAEPPAGDEPERAPVAQQAEVEPPATQATAETPPASAEPAHAAPTKQDECNVLAAKLSAKSTLQVNVQTRSPHGDGSDEDRTEGMRACERVLARLSKSDRASALVGCDVSLITLSAGTALLAKLCADRDVYMVTEDQPVVLK